MQTTPQCELDNGKISSTQFLFAIICYLQASTLLSAIITSITKSDTGEVVILALIASTPLYLIYYGIMKAFPGKNLFSVNEVVFGKIGGKTVSAMYLWFFITLTSLTLRDLGDFVKMSVLFKTPQSWIVAVFVLVVAFSMRYGIKGITKYCTLLCFIVYFITLTTLFMAINILDFSNFLPFFDYGVEKYVQGTHILTTIPFGELVVFLMFTPNVEKDGAGMRKYWLIGLLFGGLFFLIIIVRNIAIFGDAIGLFTNPSFEAHKLLSLFQSIDRVEIVFAVELIILKFYRHTILYYASVLGIAQIFGLKTIKPIILLTGVICIVYSVTLYQSTIDHVASAHATVPFIWLIFEFLLPLITLVLAKARKLPQKIGGAAN